MESISVGSTLQEVSYWSDTPKLTREDTALNSYSMM